jgi:hypothetical protein
VVEQPGRIRVVKNGVLLPTPFLDISDMVGYGGERGLLGHFSFDRATNDLWIGDVGQAKHEEVDRSVASVGYGRRLNFGWRVMEGRHCYSPSTGCSTSGKTLPFIECSHSVGCAVTGGYVYRGSAVPTLYAHYVFADYCAGTIWHRATRAFRAGPQVPADGHDD